MTLLRCIWCKCETTADEAKVTASVKIADQEHIFPESVGGRKRLEKGKVCQSCNHGFHKVDRDLRDKNTMMANQYQKVSRAQGGPIGKVRNKKDRERKEAMLTNMTANDGGTLIKREDNDDRIVRLINVPGGTGSEPYVEQFSRSLHKCAVNVLYDQCEYDDMRPRFDRLIEFVRTGKADYRDWSYGIYYADTFQAESFEPCGVIAENNDSPTAVVLFFPALIAVVGLYPQTLEPYFLSVIGDTLSPSQVLNTEDDAEAFERHYNGGFFQDSGTRNFGSKFGLQFRKRLIDPQPRVDGDFHILFKCDVCGQVNPSPFVAAKSDVLMPRSSHMTRSRSEGWNAITKEDLRLQGYQVDKWDPEDLSPHLKQPFLYPADREFINRDGIQNNSQPCINCGCMVTWSGQDLFI